MIITAEIKDKVLMHILSYDESSFYWQYENCQEELGISPDYLEMILEQFEDLGLIDVTFTKDISADIDVKAKAHDLICHGGFTAEEELLKANIQKLSDELDLLKKQLSPDHLTTITNLTQIGSNILQSLTLFQ